MTRREVARILAAILRDESQRMESASRLAMKAARGSLAADPATFREAAERHAGRALAVSAALAGNPDRAALLTIRRRKLDEAAELRRIGAPELRPTIQGLRQEVRALELAAKGGP